MISWRPYTLYTAKLPDMHKVSSDMLVIWGLSFHKHSVQFLTTNDWMCEHHWCVRTAHLFQNQGMELPYQRKQLQTEAQDLQIVFYVIFKSDGIGFKTNISMIMGTWKVCEASVFGTLLRRLLTPEDSTRNSTSVTQQRLHHPATACKPWPQEIEEEMAVRPAAIHNRNLD